MTDAPILPRPIWHSLPATFLLRGLAIALTFVQALVLTRVFGAALYGALSLGISVVTLAVLVLSGGLDQVLMRDLARIGPAQAATSARWAALIGAIRHLLPRATLVWLLGFALVFAVSGPLQLPLLAAWLCVPALLARKFLENLALGLGRVAASMFASQFVFPLLMITTALAVSHIPSASTLSLAFVASASVASLIALRIVWPEMRALAPAQLHTPDAALWRSGQALAILSLGFIASQHVDVILTGLIASPLEAGLIRVATRVAEMLGLLRMVAVLHYKPTLAAAFGRGDMCALQDTAQRMTLIFVTGGSALFVVLWVFAPQLLAFFGPEFPAAAPLLRIYLIGIAATLLSGPALLVLSLCNHEHRAARLLWSALALNIALDVILIPLHGALGCAISNAVALIFLSVAAPLTVRRRLGFDPSVLSLFLKAHP